MSFWGTGINNDFTGLYKKSPRDLYTFIGYDEKEFHKYEEIDSSYFFALIDKNTIIGMFPEFVVQYYIDRVDVFNNWSIKYFKCNEYLIMRKSGYEYVFKFDFNDIMNTININKILGSRYYFEITRVKIGIHEPIPYYVNIEITNNKISFHLKHLKSLKKMIKGYPAIKRHIDIIYDILNDLDISKFDSFTKSASVVKKYSL